MRRFRRIALTLCLLPLAGAAGLYVAVRSTSLPEGLTRPPPMTPALVDTRGRTIAIIPNDLARECRPLPFSEMGDWLPKVTVGIEDHRFWDHHGVSFWSSAGAAFRNFRNGRIISGASTITQQLSKIASGRQGRTYPEKFRESLMALRLEQVWTKRQILHTYLNLLDYGNRRIGPEAASQAYFGKPAKNLSLAEAIYMAGLPQSPARLSPWSNPAGALARYERNVRRLAAIGFLPPDTNVDLLLAHPPKVARHDPPSHAPHFAALVSSKPNLGTDTIRTSLDLDIQQAAEMALASHISAVGAKGVGDAAIVVLENSTGEVRALACAGDPKNSAINSAVQPRSCGSTLKPFLYLRAIDQRKLTAASLLPDTPDAITEEYRDYDPQNYSRRYLGPVRVREALGNSLNVPAVVALSQLGARETFGTIKTWGMGFPSDFDAYGAGFILGNAPVRLLELAGAYAGLARGGVTWKPKLAPTDSVVSVKMSSPEAARIITDILCDPRARLVSFGSSSPLNMTERTAVKTGTSSGFRDGWCIGYNKTHTVAVWAGNLGGRAMNELLAVRSAAPLWATMMNILYKTGSEPLPDPVESPGLERKTVAAETGLLPRPTDLEISEWFLPGTAPTQNATMMYDGDKLLLPQEYAVWCASPQNHLNAALRSGPLKIVFPKSGSTFVFNPSLPTAQQVLPLRSSQPDCEWYLNGVKLSEPSIPLTRGEWSLSATVGGQSAISHFTVE